MIVHSMREKQRSLRRRGMKTKKGFLAVRVGYSEEEEEEEEEEDDGDRFQRFTMPISYLYHPEFQKLLEMTQEVYGFHVAGPLRLPCSVHHFLHLKRVVEREAKLGHRRRHGGDDHVITQALFFCP